MLQLVWIGKYVMEKFWKKMYELKEEFFLKKVSGTTEDENGKVDTFVPRINIPIITTLPCIIQFSQA